MRGWMAEGKSYVPPVPLGDVMRAYAVGTVDAIEPPRLQAGRRRAGHSSACRQYAISKGERRHARPTRPGTAAALDRRTWHARLDRLFRSARSRPAQGRRDRRRLGGVRRRRLARRARSPRSRAAAPLASPAGPRSAATSREKLGFDACVDYKSPTFSKELKAACPRGIDVYFENVGGEVLDTVLPQMNMFGRIPVCGLISAYNATELPPGPKNIRVRADPAAEDARPHRVRLGKPCPRRDRRARRVAHQRASSRSARTCAKAESMPSPTCSTCSTPAATTASWC